jgi:hypothetical protein
MNRTRRAPPLPKKPAASGRKLSGVRMMGDPRSRADSTYARAAWGEMDARGFAWGTGRTGQAVAWHEGDQVPDSGDLYGAALAAIPAPAWRQAFVRRYLLRQPFAAGGGHSYHTERELVLNALAFIEGYLAGRAGGSS